MRLVLDVENTISKRDKKNILDPFEPGLELVQVGMQNVDNTCLLYTSPSPRD